MTDDVCPPLAISVSSPLVPTTFSKDAISLLEAAELELLPLGLDKYKEPAFKSTIAFPPVETALVSVSVSLPSPPLMEPDEPPTTPPSSQDKYQCVFGIEGFQSFDVA